MARHHGLRDDAELLFDTPAPAAFPRAGYLDLAVWHDFKVDLKGGFKVILVRGPGSQQGGLWRMTIHLVNRVHELVPRNGTVIPPRLDWSLVA
jgi:hypothetical protein